ncbi:translation initiation factor IF-3 [endosymbiont of Pachyrhynchus infernalis]|nr:translation initiation factor IF-3 [endosymbiont of Pachyrhynchus infernalis]
MKKVDNNYLNLNSNLLNSNIRLIDIDGSQIGIFTLDLAFKKSKDLNLDLIELNLNHELPVYKLVNLNKFLYYKNKNIKKNKRKQNLIQLKEIKIRPNIYKKDLDIKIFNIIKFINKKYKVKIIMKFIGREIIHKNIGIDIFKYIIEKTKDISTSEFISNKNDKHIGILLLFK